MPALLALLACAPADPPVAEPIGCPDYSGITEVGATRTLSGGSDGDELETVTVITAVDHDRVETHRTERWALSGSDDFILDEVVSTYRCDEHGMWLLSASVTRSSVWGGVAEDRHWDVTYTGYWVLPRDLGSGWGTHYTAEVHEDGEVTEGGGSILWDVDASSPVETPAGTFDAVEIRRNIGSGVALREWRDAVQGVVATENTVLTATSD